MCAFIGIESVAPGWGCCRCRVYNGLQRMECRSCGQARHEIKIPDNVVQCTSCGFGLVKGQKVTQTLAGRDVRDVCPACGVTWPEVAVV